MNEPKSFRMNRRDAIKRTALMLGVALSSSSIQSALARPEVGAGARYLTSQEYETMDALSEVILPRSDSPGARDVAVAAFADVTCGKFMSDSEAELFRSGLAAFEKASVDATGARFAKLAVEKQSEFFGEYCKNVSGVKKRFVRKVRELSLLGYFTSEEVAKNVLQYDPIPGDYVGCVSWETGAANWSY